MLAQAKEAFSHHQFSARDDSGGRWLLQRPYEDGAWRWDMAAEIIALAGGQLYVGGDVDFCIFAYNNSPAAQRVRWMGLCTDVDYYVAQKAHIGTGRELTEVFDEEIAVHDLQGWLADAEEADGEDGPSHDTEKLRELLEEWRDYGFPEGEHELMNELWYSGLSGDFFVDRRHMPGMVLAPRVYYTHAALARLCELLDASAPARHFCSANTDGSAVDFCKEDEEGRLSVQNGEYASEVFFCPFCGTKAPTLPRCKCNFGIADPCPNCLGGKVPLIHHD
jgi:hypothetical protein